MGNGNFFVLNKPFLVCLNFSSHKSFLELNKVHLLINLRNICGPILDFRPVFCDLGICLWKRTCRSLKETTGLLRGVVHHLAGNGSRAPPFSKLSAFPLPHLASRTRGALPRAQQPRDPGSPGRWMLLLPQSRVQRARRVSDDQFLPELSPGTALYVSPVTGTARP